MVSRAQSSTSGRSGQGCFPHCCLDGPVCDLRGVVESVCIAGSFACQTPVLNSFLRSASKPHASCHEINQAHVHGCWCKDAH